MFRPNQDPNLLRQAGRQQGAGQAGRDPSGADEKQESIRVLIYKKDPEDINDCLALSDDKRCYGVHIKKCTGEYTFIGRCQRKKNREGSEVARGDFDETYEGLLYQKTDPNQLSDVVQGYASMCANHPIKIPYWYFKEEEESELKYILDGSKNEVQISPEKETLDAIFDEIDKEPKSIDIGGLIDLVVTVDQNAQENLTEILDKLRDKVDPCAGLDTQVACLQKLLNNMIVRNDAWIVRKRARAE